MALFSNSKRRLGTSLMVFGMLALIVSHSSHSLSNWFFGAYLITFVSGMVLNALAWKDEKKARPSPWGV
jgi:hypothetical protein